MTLMTTLTQPGAVIPVLRAGPAASETTRTRA